MPNKTLISYNQDGITYTNSISVINEVNPTLKTWTNNGGNANSNEFDAVSDFFNYLDRNGMTYGSNGVLKRINLCVGNSITEALVPQVSAVGSTADVATGTPGYSSTGGIETNTALGNYFSSTVTETMLNDNITLGVFFECLNGNAGYFFFISGDELNFYFQSVGNESAGAVRGYNGHWNSGDPNYFAPVATSQTTFDLLKTYSTFFTTRSNTDHQIYFNGSPEGLSVAASKNVGTRELLIGNSYAGISCHLRVKGYFIGTGINDAQASLIHTAFTNFNDRLGRTT